MNYNDYELFYLIAEGVEEAKDILINKYQNYLYYLINDRLYLLRDGAYLIDDLYQEGLLAFLDALKSYNPRSEVRFVYYMKLVVVRRFSRIYKNSRELMKRQVRQDGFQDLADPKMQEELKLFIYKDLIQNETEKFLFECLLNDVKPRHLAIHLGICQKECYRLIRSFKKRYRDFLDKIL